ncbi:DUF2971 domain-containing protein [Marinobacter flavimaris]|uniref:DUF2971 domain-containing protein n=1 Tax=Marinobacter flavimaris TaxID=262076 RepID=UPI00386301E3
MLYYRYRPSGELALKELLYDEIFLASATECNDPYDGMAFLSLGPDYEKWYRLIQLAWDGLDLPGKDELAATLTDHITTKCPISYTDALAFDFEQRIVESARQFLPFAPILAQRIRSLLDLYKPRPPYFASFSLNRDHPLMWSHYASMHQGHCLIFRDLDGKLRQCPRRMRSTIRRSAKQGLAPNMSYGVPQEFPFQEISYADNTESLDGFTFLPQTVSLLKLSEPERLELNKTQSRHLLTKHEAWNYEDEVRVSFSPGTSWLFGEHLELTPLERLIHFQPTQLVGIVMGARMTQSNRARIREICKARMDRIMKDIGKQGVEEPLFNFAIFQASLLSDRRDLEIKPVEILTGSGSLSPDDERFSELVEQWQRGSALVFDGKGASKRYFD